MSFLKRQQPKKTDAQYVCDLLNDSQVQEQLFKLYTDFYNRACETKSVAEPPPETVSPEGRSLTQITELWKKYKCLNESIQRQLECVVNAHDVLTFVVSGCLDDNLFRLWDCLAKLSTSKGHADDFCALSEIFDFYFKLRNEAGSTRRLKRLEPCVGEKYDEEFCRVVADDSDVIGTISEVVLPGFRYPMGEVVKKSVVRVVEE